MSDTRFRFLNAEYDLRSERQGLMWEVSRAPRLWQYNLHYFDYLREQGRSQENKNTLINSWIASNQPGTEPAWEPFPTSLRIVNWVFYFCSLQEHAEIPQHWIDSLYKQAVWLERNDERHILANHYFENLKALLFAACYLDCPDSHRWLKRCLVEIPAQLVEQTLPDGGHYERSPLYHSLMIENYLDLCNLALAHRMSMLPPAFLDQVRAVSVRGLRWLSETVLPDGTIPLFNDSAFGIAPTPAELFGYARKLGIQSDSDNLNATPLIDLPSTGLYGFRVGGTDMFLIDCGDIGPNYQPGHTHCDFLSYELMVDLNRMIVDTGVCEYELGTVREHVRSTRAHNTIAVDDAEQTEIWGAFRVARRARRISAEISDHRQFIRFHGAYRGFHAISGQIEHSRIVDVFPSQHRDKILRISITDHLAGKGEHLIENRVHLHPDISLKFLSSNEVLLIRDRSVVAQVVVDSHDAVHAESGIYCPEFGIKLPNPVIVMTFRGTLPKTLGYHIDLQMNSDIKHQSSSILLDS